MPIRAIVTGLLLALAVAARACANEPVPVGTKIFPEAGGTFRIEVTVRHADKGFEHFADRWEVRAPDGRVLATRVLLHPHEDEQPFTRDQPGVDIPTGVRQVTIRVHDRVHGWGPKMLTIDVPGR